MSSFGNESHLAEVRFNRESRTFHDRERQVRVSSGAATIDQTGFRGQLRLRNQSLTGEARQTRRLGLITGKCPGSFESCAGGEVCPHLPAPESCRWVIEPAGPGD